MKQIFLVVLMGSLAFVLATNDSNSTISVSNDKLADGSQLVEVRVGDKPFKPSPQDQLKNEDDRQLGDQPVSILFQQQQGSEDQVSEEENEKRTREIIPALGQSLQVDATIPQDQGISLIQEIDDGNNTIAVAGSGHYDHHQVLHSFGHYGHHPIPHHHHHHPQHKPLKPSVVHRDPHAHFDPHDAVRTQDHDRHHQVYPSAYTKHVGHGDHHHNSLYGHAYGYEHHKPYHYNPNLTPECSHKNRYYYNLTFCLEDSHYPTETILWALRQSGHAAQRLLSDVTYQSADNLVDGLTRAEEEGYTYNHYFGASHHQHHNLDQYKPPYHGYTYSPEYYKTGGYICPSDVYYARPRRAMNTYGRWKVIVNLDYIPNGYDISPGHGHHHHHYGHDHKHKQHTYTQTLRLEQCIYANAPCSYIDSHIYSRCLQKHNFVRLVAWTYEEGLHIDTFKMPIACSCHIKQPVHYYQPHTHHLPAVHTVAVAHPTHGNYGHGK